MIKCEECKNRCYPEDKYCGKCGAKLSTEFKTSYTNGLGNQMIEATQATVNTAYIQYKLGLVYYKKGKLNDAIAAWQKALKFDPTNENAKMMLEKAALENNVA